MRPFFRAKQKRIAQTFLRSSIGHPADFAKGYGRLPRRGSPFILLPPAPSVGGGTEPIVNNDPPAGVAPEAGAPKLMAGVAAAFAPAPNENGALPVVPDGSVVLPVAGEAG